VTTKIKIPKLDPELFEIVGSEHKKHTWTDQQLGEHLAVLECIVRYFKGRDDAGIILSKLRGEYDVFLSFKEARESGK